MALFMATADAVASDGPATPASARFDFSVTTSASPHGPRVGCACGKGFRGRRRLHGKVSRSPRSRGAPPASRAHGDYTRRRTRKDFLTFGPQRRRGLLPDRRAGSRITGRHLGGDQLVSGIERTLFLRPMLGHQRLVLASGLRGARAPVSPRVRSGVALSPAGSRTFPWPARCPLAFGATSNAV